MWNYVIQNMFSGTKIRVQRGFDFFGRNIEAYIQLRNVI